MSIGLLLITHPSIAQSLWNTAVSMLGQQPLEAAVLEVPFDAPREDMCDRAKQSFRMLNQGDGVLVLTDLYGSTPSNIAHCLLEFCDSRVICGLNLPMLIRVLNYPDLGLDELAEKAMTGGQRGIALSIPAKEC